MEGIKIREAVREDCQAIRSLVQELADFQNMSDGPKIDSKVLEEDGFNSEHPFFKCYVAESKERLVGYTLYYYTYSSWMGKTMVLQDLYVTPDFRKKHIGSGLFKTIAKKATDSGCTRLDFLVLNWNPAQDFYKSQGAVDITEKDGWHNYRLDGEELAKFADAII